MNYKFSELKYNPTDYEALKKEIVELTEKAEEASSSIELDDVLRAYDAALSDVGYNYTLTYIFKPRFFRLLLAGSIAKRE